MAARTERIVDAAHVQWRVEHQLIELPELDDLVVHYQPVVDLESERVVGFEALVRWEHPRRGLLYPKDFLAIAEQSGFVPQLGRRVGEIAVRQLADWQRAFPSEPGRWISVNVSAQGLCDSRIADGVRGALDASDMDPSSLILELTETVLLDVTPANTAKLEELKGIGVGLALDDFGTGYASLRYLRTFPFDYLKIDTSFTADLPSEPRAMLLADSILQIAHTFGIIGIAEGIERQDQADCLMDMGWPLGQGYLFARPAGSETITAYLAAVSTGFTRPRRHLGLVRGGRDFLGERGTRRPAPPR